LQNMTGSNLAFCGNPHCHRNIETKTTGRRRRFCSDGCRQQAYRGRNSRYEMAPSILGCPRDLNASAAVYSKTATFVTAKINDLATPQNRGSDIPYQRWSDGIVGPRKVVQAEVINGRKKVCRMHGARGGAPEGKRNGNYRHGARSKETIELRKLIKSLR
jgi:hypothetical protein